MKFIIPGQPVPQERHRFGKGNFFTAPRTRAYRNVIQKYAKAAGIRKLDGDLFCRVVIHNKDRRRRDGDNVVKTIQDALNGIAYEDDSQIKLEMLGCLVDPKKPRCEVEIRALTENDWMDFFENG